MALPEEKWFAGGSALITSTPFLTHTMQGFLYVGAYSFVEQKGIKFILPVFLWNLNDVCQILPKFESNRYNMR